ncbi:MAG: Holliday junction resolvase RuvX [Firmicutes bacterium]|nr:Holliday junction resolvase RuvX [Bacillota bacterium]
MRILGIDYGDARIGLALSDETGMIAGALPTYQSVSMRKDADYIAALALQHEAGRIVLGLPLNMDGTKGERALKTEAFGRVLGRITGLEVVYKDERLTTKAAERDLESAGVRRLKQKNLVDAVAATLILQSYLDKLRASVEVDL